MSGMTNVQINIKYYFSSNLFKIHITVQCKNYNIDLWSCNVCRSNFFFDIELYELFICIGYSSLISHIICKYFLPFSRLSFCFVNDFLCCAKAFKLNQVPFVYFCFYFLYFRRQIYKQLLSFLWCCCIHLNFKF